MFGLEDLDSRYVILECGLVFDCIVGSTRTVFDNGRGYKMSCLKTKNGKYKNFYLHRLVSMKYIRNPNKYKEVNHIDHKRSNNNMYNLEWCTRKQNCNNILYTSRRSIEYKGKFKGKNNSNARGIEHWSKVATPRSSFKRTCKRMGYNFDDFNEIFNGWYMEPKGRRRRIYRYDRKVNK